MNNKLLYASSGGLLVLCLGLVVVAVRQASTLQFLQVELAKTRAEIAAVKQSMNVETEERKKAIASVTSTVDSLKESIPVPVDGKPAF